MTSRNRTHRQLGGAVLIVDDDPDFRALLARAAERRGLEVVAVDDGAAAAQHIRDRQFDVLVLDIHVPGVDGLELLKLGKQQDGDVQGIILTGQATVENAVEALRLDAFDYLVKPFETLHLFEMALVRALERRQLIKENQQLFEQVQRLAVTDPLTGLYNRRRMDEFLKVEIERVRRYGRKLSTIMIDVDNLKDLNDRHGHPAGDEVLQELAEVILRSKRKMDLAVRLGGDEFIVLLPETGIEPAIKLAERIASASQSIRCGDEAVYFSIGVTEWGPAVSSSREFIEHADQALYEAKQAGGRRIAVGDRLILAWGGAGMD